MEKDKSRGIKHIKGKAKYKDNTKKNAKYIPPKNKPNLESNWDRYKEEIPEKHEHILTSSNDFAFLASLPISLGSHFKYKVDEKEARESIDNTQDNLFCLNLDLLNKSILTVPLYERLGIPKDYFKDEEINEMENTAKSNSIVFRQAFNERELSKNQQCNEIKSEKSSKPDTTDDILDITESCVIHDNESVPEEQPVRVQRNEDENKDDLELWLDDILDD